jgi:hypothetical protein
MHINLPADSRITVPSKEIPVVIGTAAIIIWCQQVLRVGDVMVLEVTEV